MKNVFRLWTITALITLVFVEGLAAAPPTAIYLAGHYQNSSGKDIACYWVNGAKTDLPTTGNAQATAIAVVP